MTPNSHLCERARAWTSLRTDGELSELETALLDAHLGRCDACRTFAVGTEQVATALRAAHLERPIPFVLPPPRVRHTAIRALQVAAAVTLVVSAGVVAAISGPSGGSSAAKPVSMVAGVDSPDGLRELRRPGLVGQARAVVIPRNRQGEAV
jgi:predicted anti-sigma-YlaC factor YlaD